MIEKQPLTFLSNSGGNFIDFKSFTSLSENRRSWSAEVPLKNPLRQKLLSKSRLQQYVQLTCVSHRRCSRFWGLKSKEKQTIC